MDRFLQQQIVYMLPMFVIYLGGLIISLTQRKRAPLAATLAALACGVFLVLTLAFPLIQTYLLNYGDMGVLGGADSGQILQLTSLIRLVLHGMATCLLLTAVFANRGGETAEDELRRRGLPDE